MFPEESSQDSFNSCSDEPTFDDLFEGNGWGSSREPNRL
jgi:hypothetical protein